jgi:hypothetical protein
MLPRLILGLLATCLLAQALNVNLKLEFEVLLCRDEKGKLDFKFAKYYLFRPKM